MTSFKQLNRQIFDFAPARWAGAYIYDWRRRQQPPTQSTTTKFFRNLQQLAALEGPLSNLTQNGSLSVLVAGCSYGCEAYSLAGFLALRFPELKWQIDAVDISCEALSIAGAARYTSEHGLGSAGDDVAKQLEASLFDRSDGTWTVVPDIRQRVSFGYGDVLSAEFQKFTNYDLVLGQNFMIYMNDASAATALSGARRGRKVRRGAVSRRHGSRHQNRPGGPARSRPPRLEHCGNSRRRRYAPLGVALVLLVTGAARPGSPRLSRAVQHDISQALSWRRIWWLARPMPMQSLAELISRLLFVFRRRWPEPAVSNRLR